MIRPARAALAALLALGVGAADAAAQPGPAPTTAPPPEWMPAAAAPTTTSPAEMAEAAVEADLLSELQEVQEESSALQIYGFADFTYTRFLMDESSGWYDTYFSVHPTFGVGNLNLYLEKRIAARWRSLVEFRLLYLPNGSEEISESGEASRVDTTVIDPLDKIDSLRWGGIAIERAWVEYQAHPLATIRAGQWITPYGIWNVDHGSPVLIPIRRPFNIGLAQFPRSQTGLMVHGSRLVGDTRLVYQATLSNGRGPVDTYLDLDGNKAVGGRLVAELPALDELTVGASAYAGTYTARTRTYGIGGESIIAEDIVTERYRELSTGLDLRLRRGPLLVNLELLTRQARYDDAARPISLTSIGEQQPDFLSYGGYGLVGYRLPWVAIMPYVVGEYVHPMWAAVPHVVGGMFGLNARVTPAVTLKAQLQWAKMVDALPGLLSDDPILNCEAQVAWTF